LTTRTSLSHSAAVILQAVANGYRYGFDIMDITGLPSGSVYPALRRMERAGLVDSNWETEGLAQDEGRPPRRYYEVTPAGAEALAEALKRYRLIERLLPTRKPRPSRQRG
jgi:DNA-binding PadR family transcriptional regulator